MRITKLILIAVLPLAACSSETSTSSSLSGHGDNGTNGDCTLTQGYWKNHPKAWAVSSLELGSVTYAKDELIDILKEPVKGNGLVQLAHQLIAAKLNIAGGVSDASIKSAIEEADALIGSLVCPPKGKGELATKDTSAIADKLEAFNSGKTGPGHCGKNDHGDNDDCDSDSDTDTDGDGVCEGDHDDDEDTDSDHCDHDHDGDGQCDHDDDDCDQPPAPTCGNHVVETGEACDDGNTTNHDGCSSTCQIELPVCGNGVIETGETCDDGNTLNGDGCSSVCICEPCH